MPTVGALLPLADWPVHGSNGGRCHNSQSGAYVSFRARRVVRKVNPRLAKFISVERWDFFALTVMISALCLTCEVSGGGKAACIHGSVDCVAVQVCHLQRDCLHVQITGMALNSAGFEVVGSSESDTEVALDLCSVHDSTTILGCKHGVLSYVCYS